MKKLVCLFFVSFVAVSAMAISQTFQLHQPDYEKSPYTGVTRHHWIEAATWMLEGAFNYINTLDDPMYFPKQLEKTYPRNEYDTKVAKLEGLARTLFVAAPLLRENPDLTLHGIKVADYYRHQLMAISNPTSKNYIPHQKGGPSQTTLELSAIAFSMRVAEEVVWRPLPQEEKDRLAATIKSYGEGPTIDSNWMFFNVFSLSFLKSQGYEVDEKKMVNWLEKLLDRYRGEGWYNDAPAYDYYSMWAYQSYGPLWAKLFAQQMRPNKKWGFADDIYQRLAERFVNNSRDLLYSYPYMFARDGKMNMWGRSVCYRFASVTPLPLLEWAGIEGVNYGWLRRIASATLLQFVQHPDFLENGVPTMGFYGPFAPCVQIYSCRGSVYWMGKAFLSLLLPESSHYWSSTENEGPWKDEMKQGKVYNRFHPSTGLLVTNYPNSGCSEMRSWCHETVAGDWQKFRSSENYNKLAYNTAFPWMADGQRGEVSMNYATLNDKGQWEVLRLYDIKNFDNEVYHREAVLETNKNISYELNDITLPDGILRVDRVTLDRETEVSLGHYALAQRCDEHGRQLDFTTRRLAINRQRDSAVVCSNGEYELSMIPLLGWSAPVDIVKTEGLHPVSHQCVVPMLRQKMSSGKHLLITLQLFSKSEAGAGLSVKQLSAVKRIKVSKDQCSVTVTLADGTTKTIVFS